MVALLKNPVGHGRVPGGHFDGKAGDILENVRAAKPDILLIDIYLGDRNGLDIVRQIRQTPDLKDIRIIMASGIDKTEECLEPGQTSSCSSRICPRAV